MTQAFSPTVICYVEYGAELNPKHVTLLLVILQLRGMRLGQDAIFPVWLAIFHTGVLRASKHALNACTNASGFS